MQVYVIKRNKDGQYYSHVKVVESTPVMLRGALVGTEDKFAPVFSSSLDDASKYLRAADCTDMMTHPLYGAEKEFSDCVACKVDIVPGGWWDEVDNIKP